MNIKSINNPFSLFSFSFRVGLSFLFTLSLIAAVSDNCLAEEKKIQEAIEETKGSALLSGTVLETMNSGGYTYFNIKDKEGKERWVAIPETKITKGEEIRYYDGMVMKNFTSKTLKRTFPAIIFSSGLADKEKTSPHDSFHGTRQTKKNAAKESKKDDSFAAAIEAEKETGKKEMQSAEKREFAETSGGSMAAIVPFMKIKVAKAAGENGYTVGGIFERAEELNGKTVQVRGQVVKFSPMIMNRNWIHLQDGSGDPMKNHHDLVVTSMEKAEEGSTILIEGRVVFDKDFGAGYRYEVLIEDAVMKKSTEKE